MGEKETIFNCLRLSFFFYIMVGTFHLTWLFNYIYRKNKGLCSKSSNIFGERGPFRVIHWRKHENHFWSCFNGIWLVFFFYNMNEISLFYIEKAIPKLITIVEIVKRNLNKNLAQESEILNDNSKVFFLLFSFRLK